jgi:dynactin 1
MEKRIDVHINLLRREEFREMECVSDIVKCVFPSVPHSDTTNSPFPRIHAQFDHISETYFAGFDFDLGERELGYALSFDHDLDMSTASLGLVKTSIEAVMKEDGKLGITLVPGSRVDAGRSCTRCDLGYGRLRPRRTLYAPLRRVLDQCRSGKNPSRYISRLDCDFKSHTFDTGNR